MSPEEKFRIDTEELSLTEAMKWGERLVFFARQEARLLADGIEIPEAQPMRIGEVARHAEDALGAQRVLVPRLEAELARAGRIEEAARALVSEHRERRRLRRGSDILLDALEDALAREDPESEGRPEP